MAVLVKRKFKHLKTIVKFFRKTKTVFVRKTETVFRHDPVKRVFKY